MLVPILSYAIPAVLLAGLIWRWWLDQRAAPPKRRSGGRSFADSLVFGVLCGFLGFTFASVEKTYLYGHFKRTVEATQFRLDRGEFEEVKRIYDQSVLLLRQGGDESQSVLSRAWKSFLLTELYKGRDGEGDLWHVIHGSPQWLDPHLQPPNDFVPSVPDVDSK